MKRMTVAVLATTLAASLAACGGGGGDSSAPAGEAKGEITFSSHLTGMDKVVEAFNASQDDIEVTFELVPAPSAGGTAKLTNGLKAGNAPDLATIEYQDLPSFVSQGGIEPVGELAEGALENLPEGALSAVTFGDETWAVPYDAPPMVFWYREDVFTELGLEPPTTWDDFKKAAETIKQKKKAYIASFWPNEPRIVAATAAQNGARWFETEGDTWHVDLNSPETEEVASYWQDLIDSDLVKVEEAFSDEWSNSLATGKVVGYVGASWGAAGLRDRTPESAGKWRVAQIPSWDGEPTSALLGGSTFAVTKDSENPEAAAAFAEWVTTNPEALKARGDVGVAYPANPDMTATAKESVDTAHFGGQDIYAEFDKASAAVVEGWTWGPTQSTLATLADGFGSLGNGGTIAETLAKAEETTVAQMEQDGLNVEAGS